jgi:hypothetical protein
VSTTVAALGEAARAEDWAHRRWRLRAFGLDVDSDLPLPGTQAILRRRRAAASSPHALALRAVPREELAPLGEQARVLRYRTTFDGCRYAMLDGEGSDVLFDYRPRALFHLSADRQLLRYAAPCDDADRSWQRVLLDTVLWTTSLLCGFELLHASAVETPAGIVAFVAISGGGKTSLAAELLRRGAGLFCDDILALDDSGGRLTAHPGPPLLSLPGSVCASSLGRARTLACFDDEQWVQIERPPATRRPVAAIVLLDRHPGAPTECLTIDATNLTLLPYAIGFPHLADRARRRFEILGALADAAPILRLSADPTLPAAALADLIEHRIPIR